MNRSAFVTPWGFLALPWLCAAAENPIHLMPAVSEVQWQDALAIEGDGVIVLSDEPSRPEREAARILAASLERRFGRRLPVQSGSNALADARLRIFLGQRRTWPTIDRLCGQQNLAVPEQSDGYALKVWAEGNSAMAVVAGTNDRGVLYGQDTLFQLFKGAGQRLTVRAATIRDWPTIPLRGRPHPHYEYFFKSENMDLLVSSRINWIDLRDGVYAFEPDAKLKKDELSGIVVQAKARGQRIYAAVNCGVPADQQDEVLALFKEFIDLGADALTFSFDDKGPGEDPERMVARALALGREHGIVGDAIAITPPKGAYQVVNHEFNRKIVAVPGMEQAMWFWTSVPCAGDAADGEAIGLRVRPSWWHNWPRFRNPALHGGGDRSYVPVLNMADGWNHPTEKELKEAGQYVHGVMPWDGWQAQQHYLVPVIGWWSWRPEQYSASSIRRRIYELVFGPGQEETAAQFDDRFAQVHRRFQFWATHTEFAPQCPPRLESLADRGRVRSELEFLGQLVADLREKAPKGSLLDRELLRRDYLDPMQREIQTGLAQAAAPYPEYWWPEHQDRLLHAIYEGDLAKANQLAASVRERVLREIEQVEALLNNPAMTGQYAKWWRERANADAADWKALLVKRQAALRDRITDYGKSIAPTKAMLANLHDPPVQIGTRAWERHNHVMATVVPEPRETFWGDWIGGLYNHAGTQVAVFAHERHDRVNAGTYSELPVNIPVSGRRDRLALVIYVANVTKESFGFGYAKWRWSGTRALRLMWGEREVWKADLGIPRTQGEWFVVPLPELPQGLQSLPLRLRLEDYYNAKNNLQIVYVGPIRLLELDRG